MDQEWTWTGSGSGPELDKIEIESKLKGMKDLHEEKLHNQTMKRSSRIQHRKEKKEY